MSFESLKWISTVIVRWSTTFDLPAMFEGVEISTGGIAGVEYNGQLRGTRAYIEQVRRRVGFCFHCCSKSIITSVIASSSHNIFDVTSNCSACEKRKSKIFNAVTLTMANCPRNIRLFKRSSSIIVPKNDSIQSIVTTFVAHVIPYASDKGDLHFTHQTYLRRGKLPTRTHSTSQFTSPSGDSPILYKYTARRSLLPLHIFYIVDKKGEVRLYPNTRSVASKLLQSSERRHQPTHTATTFFTINDGKDAYFSSTGCVEDFKKNYTQFIAACPAFQKTVTKV